MKITKYIIGLCLSSALIMNTSCIEETFPNDGMTEGQLEGSNKGIEARLWGIVAFVNNFGTMGTADPAHFDFGYGSMMHIRDLMTEDMAVSATYPHWSPYHNNFSMGKSSFYPQYIWNYYYKFVQTTNLLIAQIDEATATDVQKGYLGAAYAFRALQYLDMAQMYEFLPNQIYSTNAEGNKIVNLTVPIVTEKTTKEDAKNNPRATREDMVKFINGDLDKAEQLIQYLTIPEKSMPHLDVIYGLRARLYLWIADYPNAQLYARKAIDATQSVPMTEEEWLSTTRGFNNLDPWMWGSRLVKENDVVQTGIINWTSWLSNETTYGYCGNGAYVMIAASLYDKIAPSDFRKFAFKADDGSVLQAKNRYISQSLYDGLPTYASLKFRPGEGNIEDPLSGNAVSFPMMRVEEMYFIEAEAAAHQNIAEGKKLLTGFMKKYRNKSYAWPIEATDKNATIEEIILQKRIELWGEGLAFFDVKRLNMSVTRGYPGTNFYQSARLNTKGRPVWMNICIVQTEENTNKGILNYNNPDPSGKIAVWRGY